MIIINERKMGFNDKNVLVIQRNFVNQNSCKIDFYGKKRETDPEMYFEKMDFEKVAK